MMFSMSPCCRKSAVRRLEREDGFTLIELLVVLIIIGLLAAIAIATFTGQQNKAHDAEAKSAAKTAQLAMETYYVEHKSYSGRDGRRAREPPAGAAGRSRASLIQQATSNQFELSTSSTSTNPVTFTVARSAAERSHAPAPPRTTGGCKGGVW